MIQLLCGNVCCESDESHNVCVTMSMRRIPWSTSQWIKSQIIEYISLRIQIHQRNILQFYSIPMSYSNELFIWRKITIIFQTNGGNLLDDNQNWIITNIFQMNISCTSSTSQRRWFDWSDAYIFFVFEFYKSFINVKWCCTIGTQYQFMLPDYG